jgi:2-dehydro-3-deoxyglucarate aldolase/4-hydroxy-2-oxoheptanedioate aldolase
VAKRLLGIWKINDIIKPFVSLCLCVFTAKKKEENVTNFKEKLERKQPLIGTIQAMPSPDVTEMLAAAGFDWVWMDMEHSSMDVPSMQQMLQAAKDLPCLVRPPSHDKVWIKKILDAGADGLIMPLVNSAKEAERIVNLSKYPPEGCRSVGLARAHGYGMKFQEYIKEANKKITIAVQIEHINGVNNIEEIVKVKGIDAIIIGPYDLSGSMGKPGQVNDEDVQHQIDTARKAALNAGLAVGIFTADPNETKTLKEKGYTLIAIGVDTMLMGQAFQDTLQKAKL